MGLQNKIVKHMVFPSKLASQIEMRAKRFGISFAEYLRHLAIKDLESEYVEIADIEHEKVIEESMEDYKKGNYVTVKNAKDIDELFDQGFKKYKKSRKI